MLTRTLVLAWSGDVCAIVPILRKYRPDLDVALVETFAGEYRKGLAVVSSLNPKDRTLQDSAPEIEEEIRLGRFSPESIADLEQGAKILKLNQLFGHLEIDRSSKPLRWSRRIEKSGDIDGAIRYLEEVTQTSKQDSLLSELRALRQRRASSLVN